MLVVLAEILTIGDELCRGEIVDTNSAWIAEKLWDLGVTVAWMTSCRDHPADMRDAFRAATGRAGLVFVSGGLGPTEDDITVDALAEVANVGIVRHEASFVRMEKRYAEANFELTPNNLRQVRVPEGAEAFINPVGAAPGFCAQVSGASVFVMPGVPGELKAIWHDAVAARVADTMGDQKKIARRLYRVFGIGESHIDHSLKGLVDGTDGATIHYQVKFPEVFVKLVVEAASSGAAEQTVQQLGARLQELIGGRCYGEGNVTLGGVLGATLREHAATLAVAESCTGGLLGALITEIPGSSEVFLGGYVTYHNDAKVRDLGVLQATLDQHGAVSQECVTEMARGAREKTGATFAVAVSGVAGPSGGTDDKPVGTVHVAVAGPSRIYHKLLQFRFLGTRDQIRHYAAYSAMSLVLREVKLWKTT